MFTGNNDEGVALQVLSVLCEVAILVYLGLVILMRNINDEFSIRNELLVLCLFSFVCIPIMIIIQFVPSEYLVFSKTNKTFPIGSSWPDYPYIGYILGVELVGSFIISVCYPLFKSFTRDIFISDLLPCLQAKKLDEDVSTEDTAAASEVTPSSLVLHFYF